MILAKTGRGTSAPIPRNSVSDSHIRQIFRLSSVYLPLVFRFATTYRLSSLTFPLASISAQSFHWQTRNHEAVLPDPSTTSRVAFQASQEAFPCSK